MTTLIVKQILKNGHSKTWKIHPNQKTMTLGSSRLAQMISISENSPGYEGFFEFKNNHWYFNRLNTASLNSSDSPSYKISNDLDIELQGSFLKVSPFKKELNLMNQLNSFTASENSSQQMQLIITKFNEQIFDVQVLPVGKKLFKKSISISPQWITEDYQNYKIQHKTIQVENLKDLNHFETKQVLDKESRKGAYIVLALTALIVFAGVFGPKNQKEMVLAEMPKVAQKIIVKTDINKLKQKITPPQEKPKVVLLSPPAASPKTNDTPTHGGKVANMLKSISGGRISQLIGKVSSQASKTANVIYSNGVKAGQTGSGRALAALGSVEKSGRNWGSDSNGKNITISTAGRGGGKNASGMGGLSAGSTGSAGVGLIEDESEIVGGLDREIIAQYIKSQLGQILYCYERQLSANPDLFGKVAVKFTITGSGGVEQQLIGDTTLKNATVEGCILNRVAAWKFPAPQGGTKVLVTYPFLFKSTN